MVVTPFSQVFEIVFARNIVVRYKVDFRWHDAVKNVIGRNGEVYEFESRVLVRTYDFEFIRVVPHSVTHGDVSGVYVF